MLIKLNTPMTTETNHQNSQNTSKELPKNGYIRLSLLITFIPFSASTIWRKVKQGTFPKPIKLSENVTAWRAEDIHAWMNKINTEVNHG